jgi:hypothetical protein
MRLALSLILAGIASIGAAHLGAARAQDAKQVLTKAAWAGYQQYLAGQSDARHGFFAVSKDGQNWSQSGCPKGQCPSDDQLKQSAISRCQQYSAAVPCLIFAEDRTILMPYEVKEYTMYGQ